jgi:hypothetical protein
MGSGPKSAGRGEQHRAGHEGRGQQTRPHGSGESAEHEGRDARPERDVAPRLGGSPGAPNEAAKSAGRLDNADRVTDADHHPAAGSQFEHDFPGAQRITEPIFDPVADAVFGSAPPPRPDTQTVFCGANRLDIEPFSDAGETRRRLMSLH